MQKAPATPGESCEPVSKEIADREVVFSWSRLHILRILSRRCSVHSVRQRFSTTERILIIRGLQNIYVQTSLRKLTWSVRAQILVSGMPSASISARRLTNRWSFESSFSASIFGGMSFDALSILHWCLYGPA